MKNENTVVSLERKIRSVGTQFRWWGVVVFIAGVIIAILGTSGGIVITVLGLIMALQGAIIQYVFQQQ